ncbi:MAG: glycine cleavage system protein GcvH [Tannerella sp.]|jgi:glycine cleavage system H protein|nr:glycine cleavage system protein GcvH [Tannerella sp.]
MKKYLKTHEWVEFSNETTARIGISDYAQKALGDLVFVNLPQEGDEVQAGEAFGDVESVKAVSDVISPVTGTVAAANQEIMDNPALINEAPYDSWFIEVKDVSETAELLSEDEYAQFCEKEAQH